MATTTSVGSSTRGRPWLLPYNRRLRHLRAISLRNLTISNEFGRRRGETVDDEALPQSLNSPSKLRSRQNRRSFDQQRASTDLAVLRSIDEHPQRTRDDGALEESRNHTPLRPKRSRRRSTLDSASFNPTGRQKQLEDQIVSGMLDVFFSLHIHGIDDPIYVSESCEQTANPSFRSFSLFGQDASISRLSIVILKVWAKSEVDTGFNLLLQSEVNMRHLQFVGKNLESIKRPFPTNCVLFHLKDGIYTTSLEFATPIYNVLQSSATRSSSQVLHTSSYDALMRLSNLDICIQDAIATRKRLESEISEILDNNAKEISAVRSVVAAQEAASNAQNAVGQELKRLAASRTRREKLMTTIQARKDFMFKSREFYLEQINLVDSGETTILEQRINLGTTNDNIHGQRRRVCEDLQRIFPIDPIADAPQRSLAFSIKGLSLPNASVLDESDGPADSNSIAAALGYTALLVTQIAAYLSIPLPYPLDFRGSTSTITDSLSVSTPTTIYPLFSRSVARFRFEYAVFLLNKDIEKLADTMGLKLLDPRHTLPNLKYILFVASSGQGDLPVRKVGGFRAFLHAEAALVADNQARQSHDRDDVERTGLVRFFANGHESHLGVKNRGSRLRYES